MQLTDTQLVVLAAALNRETRSILPLPEHIKGGATAKVCASLLAKGLAAEVPARLGEPVWRTGDDDRATMLVATDAAADALGIAVAPPEQSADAAPVTDAEAPDELEAAPKRRRTSTGRASAAARAAAQTEEASPGTAKGKRSGTKQDQLIAMLRRPEGASIEEIVGAFGWQPHTVRGAIAGALKKKLGLNIGSEKIAGRGRVYRILG